MSLTGVLFLLIAGAVISITITHSRLFEPLRDRIKVVGIKDLVRCHFCLNFYLSFGALVVSHGYHGIFNFIVMWLTYVFFMTILSSLLLIFLNTADVDE